MIKINNYLKNLNRIEFVITSDCTGCCKHCSQGDHRYTGNFIDPEAASELVTIVSSKYPITSVMTFGGEPLMHPESVCAIHSAATKAGIIKRQLITNGYFTKDIYKIKDVVKKIKLSGVNDLLLSADAFHQETIPLDIVKIFASYVLDEGINIRLNPAWLVDRQHSNLYNDKTRIILNELVNLGVIESYGNNIFPEGNAKRNFSEYFDKNKEYINPYEESPYDIRSISIEPDGAIFGQNIYEKNIGEILSDYRPQI